MSIIKEPGHFLEGNREGISLLMGLGIAIGLILGLNYVWLQAELSGGLEEPVNGSTGEILRYQVYTITPWLDALILAGLLFITVMALTRWS